MTKQIYYYQHTCFMCSLAFTERRKRKIDFCPTCRTSEIYDIARLLVGNLRRARKAGLEATLTLGQWLQTIQDFQGLCAYCQIRPMACIEHFIPLSAGGGTTPDNIVPSCRGCNKHKESYLPQNILKSEVYRRVEAYLRQKSEVAA